MTNINLYPEFQKYYALGNYQGGSYYYNSQGGGDGDYLRSPTVSELNELLQPVNPMF